MKTKLQTVKEKTKEDKLKKYLACLLILLIFPVLLVLTLGISRVDNLEHLSVQRVQENAINSVELFGSLIQEIRTEVIDSTGEVTRVYSDDFAGVFIDDSGLLNVAMVTDRSNASYSFSLGQFSEQVIQHQFAYS